MRVRFLLGAPAAIPKILMSIAERIKIPGLAQGSIVDYGCNDSGQSFTVAYPKLDQIVIARELGSCGLPISIEEEFARRKDALATHERVIPEYTQTTQFAVLQGYNQENYPVPVLGRFVPKLEGVIPVTQIRASKILPDSRMCYDLFRISLAHLRVMITTGKIIDSGNCGNFCSGLPGGIGKWTSRLTSSNTLIGTNQFGENVTFCDPDWYITPAELQKPRLRKSLGYIRLFTERTVFWGGMVVLHKVKNALSTSKSNS